MTGQPDFARMVIDYAPAGGMLTVTYGSRTAHITLVGDYANAAFVASSDGHGDTLVVDPKETAVATAIVATFPLHAFIASLSAMVNAGAGAISPISRSWRETPPTLFSP